MQVSQTKCDECISLFSEIAHENSYCLEFWNNNSALVRHFVVKVLMEGRWSANININCHSLRVNDPKTFPTVRRILSFSPFSLSHTHTFSHTQRMHTLYIPMCLWLWVRSFACVREGGRRERESSTHSWHNHTCTCTHLQRTTHVHTSTNSRTHNSEERTRVWRSLTNFIITALVWSSVVYKSHLAFTGPEK